MVECYFITLRLFKYPSKIFSQFIYASSSSSILSSKLTTKHFFTITLNQCIDILTLHLNGSCYTLPNLCQQQQKYINSVRLWRKGQFLIIHLFSNDETFSSFFPYIRIIFVNKRKVFLNHSIKIFR